MQSCCRISESLKLWNHQYVTSILTAPGIVILYIIVFYSVGDLVAAEKNCYNTLFWVLFANEYVYFTPLSCSSKDNFTVDNTNDMFCEDQRI